MKRHLGAILALCLLGSMSLPGCQAVESLGKSFDNLSWGKGQSSGTETKAMAAAGESIVADLPDNCPQIKVLDELSRITQFTNQKSPKNDEKIASDLENFMETGGRGTPWSILVTESGEKFPINGAQPAAAISQIIEAATN